MASAYLSFMLLSSASWHKYLILERSSREHKNAMKHATSLQWKRRNSSNNFFVNTGKILLDILIYTIFSTMIQCKYLAY